MTTKIDGGLRPLFKKYLPMVDWAPVESPMVMGIPDTNACYRGVEFWIEFKQAEAYRVLITPHQVAWALRRTRHGGRVWIAVRQRQDNLVLMTGMHAAALEEEGLHMPTRNFAGVYTGGPRAWPWLDILRVLTQPGQVGL